MAPLTLAWEVTRSCPLRCRHCRADAQYKRNPDELNTQEGIDLIEQAAELGAKIFVITGGDPLARKDIYDLISEVSSTGMYVGFSPSVTPRLTAGTISKVKQSGVDTIHLSLDGASATIHDRFRGVDGSFVRTMRAIKDVSEAGIRLQIGTTVTSGDTDELDALASLLQNCGSRIGSWTLFFLIPTGRGQSLQAPSPQDNERILNWLATTDFPFHVRTVEGPAFHRVLKQSSSAKKLGMPLVTVGSGARPAVRDGDGFCFVSHVGDVLPSGFLQLSAGNVRHTPLVDIYRNSPLFRTLRDRDLLEGRCGSCEYRAMCGGSRARAWSVNGSVTAEDPGCAYVPAGFDPAVVSKSLASAV